MSLRCPIRAKKSARPAIHYAWIIMALTFLATLIGSGIRSSASILINPLEIEYGWSRVAISSAIGVNLLVYGLGAPIAGRMIDRGGPRGVMIGSLVLLVGGVAGSLFMKSLWHFTLLWGVAIGLAGSGVASVLGATVANRWFVARRGLAMGILNSGSSTGQLIFLPFLMASVTAAGWRPGVLVMGIVAVGILLCTALWMRNDPEEIGLQPYDDTRHQDTVQSSVKIAATKGKPVVSGELPMGAVFRHPTFWFLASSFFICGATSLGLVGTHLIPHSIDHGMPEVTIAATVGVMGGMNFIGTLLSGWLTDRIDPRKILVFAFTLRGASLFMLPAVDNFSGMFFFGIIYGLDWIATVPPVMALTADTFGKRSVGSIYGFIFLAHQLGSSLAAAGGGALRMWLGDYRMAFLMGGVLALMGGGLALGIPAKQVYSSTPSGS